ncbi:MAG: deoxyribonuclease V [Pseudomonas sp.]|uniref:deoxyribonuclease V n=1 Tax=Pseudomonas sp. TaxID=306 RepID=UPI0033985A50
METYQGWSGDARQARELQRQLAQRVRLQDDFAVVRTIAGLDVGFEQGGAVTLAAAVLLRADTLQVLGQSLARVPTCMSYVPGLLSFRELPALLEALKGLPQVPDLILCDGQGIAHPRRLGIAAHLGVVTNLPSIGVAKSILLGEHAELAPQRGAHVPLLHGAEQIGWVLRSKDRVRPLIVSPGHRVSMASAMAWVLACGRGYRLPEPTRLADRLASRRGALPAASASAVGGADLFS